MQSVAKLICVYLIRALKQFVFIRVSDSYRDGQYFFYEKIFG